MPFAKALPPGTFSFACQKRTRKAPATFEAREAAGCGSLRLLRALRGTRILQAAVPTAPPCFGHWPRSSPLQTRGCSPLVTPKLLGSIQKIQVASLKDFLCSADWKPLSRCATAPSKREPLAKPESVMVCPETFPSCQGLSLWESWQARQGLTERARMLPAIFHPFFHKHFGRCGKTARRVYLFAQKRGKINCKIRKCALRRVYRTGRTSTAHP